MMAFTVIGCRHYKLAWVELVYWYYWY